MRLRRRPALLLSLSALMLVTLAMGPCSVEEFDLGVGAFEVGEDRAILWTHVVPTDPERANAVLRLEVATDTAFTELVRSKNTFARAKHDFTVQALVTGLDADTRYHYRFIAAATELVSPIGSFRTRPLEDARGPVRFVLSGDSNLGYVAPRGLDFHVLGAAAAENPDFFVFFGDTIYADSGVLPGGASAFSLEEYREVHRLTRADFHMQTLLGATGTFTGWDDHEVVNDYDGETVDPEQFENGAQAFFEYLPLRQDPAGPPYRIDRTVRWGEHVELFFLDGRQFRSAELFCNPDPIPDGPETLDTLFSPFVEDEQIVIQIDPVLGPIAAALLLTPSDPDCVDSLLADPERTLLGFDQLAWLKQALLDSTATFKIIINNVPLSTLYVTPYDRWDGYLADQQELLDFVANNLDPSHVLVLTTDFHTNLAIQRPELTEVIIGPIGQTTFSSTVLGLLAASRLPPNLLPVFLGLFDGVVDLANGGPGVLLGSAPDAFSYGRVDVFEEAGEAKLVFTARGNPDYLAGANDPGDVVDLFSFEMP